MPQPVILSLGSANVDFQVRVDRPPEIGETLLGHDFVRLSGGKAANVAFLARRLGVGARLLAQVGDDVLTECVLEPLRAIGVDLSQTRVVKKAIPGISMIAVPPDGKKMIVLAPNANLAWSEADASRIVRAVEQAPSDSVLVVDYEVPGFVVESAVEAGRRRGLTIVLDPSPADRVERHVLARTDVVVPNPKETEGLTGIAIDGVDAAREAGARLVERGAGAVCIKLSDGGCVLVEKHRAVHVVPVPVEVEDATGAGDAFAGGLAVALLERRCLIEAACFGAAASHIAVTGYGSQPAYPTRPRLEGMFQKLRARVRMLEERR